MRGIHHSSLSLQVPCPDAVGLDAELDVDVVEFDAFTDIEFNPNRQIHCQAVRDFAVRNLEPLLAYWNGKMSFEDLLAALRRTGLHD